MRCKLFLGEEDVPPACPVSCIRTPYKYLLVHEKGRVWIEMYDGGSHGRILGAVLDASTE
jgi:hypothetical protein